MTGAVTQLLREGVKVVASAPASARTFLCDHLALDAAAPVQIVAAETSTMLGARTVLGLALERFRAVDILVNARVAYKRTPFNDDWECMLADYELLTNFNVRAPFMLGRAAVPIMKAAGRGAIVNVSSIDVLPANGRKINQPGEDLYCATRWALNGLVAAWARVLPPEIRVNNLCVETQLLHDQSGAMQAEEVVAYREQVIGLMLQLLQDERTGENVPAYGSGPLRLPASKPPHKRISGTV
jgi:NAD(P)-dependent dehydrogenase (short-subunit alcohol dehydrogenase family)